MRRALLILMTAHTLQAAQPFFDREHRSEVFGEMRHYRIFLPADYETSGAHYPVIYYFHGHSDRYTLEKYDNGLDTVPKIAAFVATHDAIVVAVDGYIARDYTGFYGGTPYDVRVNGGQYDFGEYFLELVRHIDSTYRTKTSRRFRATSGLSMGGFMSLYLSARYPELIGSASAFNPGPEFYVGESGRRSLWRPKDHVSDHEHTKIRLIRASGDYISQYHEETRQAYASSGVDFEFRQDEYHRHWATSIGETFEFHMQAFESPELDTVPTQWSYSSGMRQFAVRGYRVESNVGGAALIYLQHVQQGGLRVTTRRWAPDGPVASCDSLDVQTAPLYRPDTKYQVIDFSLASGESTQVEAMSDHEGRLRVHTDCAGHEFSFTGPGAAAQAPALLPLTGKDLLRVTPGESVGLPIRVFNPQSRAFKNLRAELRSAYPTVEILQGKVEIGQIAAGGTADLSKMFQVRFTAGEGGYARVRLELFLTADDLFSTVSEPFDVLIAPAHIPTPLEVEVLDGRQRTFTVFRQKGNQGGGSSVELTVTEGKGNGNGILEPGEEATIWVKYAQGLDPFDKNNWRRAKIYTDSPWMAEIGDIQEEKQREWTGAQNRTSLIALDSQTPPGAQIPVVLDCETWSFTYTPDVRFGKLPLYQAFQLHQHSLFAWTWSASQLKTERRTPHGAQ